MDSWSGIFGTGAVVLAIIAIFFIVLGIVARYYKKIPPNTVAVVTGREHTVKVRGPDGSETTAVRGYRYVAGGGFFLVPIVEEMAEMSLTVIPVEVAVKDVPDKNGVLVNVDGIANIKVMSTDGLLPLAIERFLGKHPEEIKQTCFMTLEGNLRGVIGTLATEELLRDREKFQQSVMDEAGLDLNKMGIGVDTFKIQSITDNREYIKSLGKKQTAEIVRNATIGEAEAKRDADKQSAEARQVGETAQAQALRAISDANRDRDVAIAENEARIMAQQAQIPIAAEIAAANRTKELNTAKVEAEKATVMAGIALQEEEKKRREAELNATTIITAEKDRDAAVIAADAKAKAAEREGEAFRVKAEKEGQGAQAKDSGVAAGRKAIASAVQAEREAGAAGEKAELLAKAAGKEADLLAVAAGTKAEKLALAAGTEAQLLAEALGALKKAEAFKQLDQTGRLLMILQSLPPVIDSLGTALEKVVTPAAEAIGEGLGNIKDVRIIDMGNGGTSGGKNLLGNFAQMPVQTLFGLWQQIQAAGLEPMVTSLAKRFGIDIPTALSGTGSADTASVTTPAAGEKPAKA